MEYYHYDVISAYYLKAEIHNRYIALAHPSVKKQLNVFVVSSYIFDSDESDVEIKTVKERNQTPKRIKIINN